ncbi:MAG: hypothetical protein JWQ29_2779 [Phenylobacterium sp.]|nr:hypothetical protein [Phenylobacterium sp.]
MSSVYSRPRLVAASAAVICAAASWLVACATPPKAEVSLAPTAQAAAEPAVPGARPTLRLISQSQYDHTIADIFGSDIATKVRFAPVKRQDGLLAIGSAAAVVTPGAFDRLEAAARTVAEQVTDRNHRAFLIPCKPASEAARDDACARQFLSQAGRLLYRRPLTERELAAKVERAGASGDFYSGLSYALASMLTSPNFLLVRDAIEPDPARPGAWRLDGYSKAARLSFLLWDAAPDDELLQAAARGDLQTDKGLHRQVERMLGAPKFENGVRAFFEDFLVLEAFDSLAKDPVLYPAYTLAVAKQAKEQVLRSTVDHLVTRKGDYRDLFTTRRTMISGDLAAIYRAPVNLGPRQWAPYEFPADDPRAGMLTQIAFLSQYAHPGRSSPTRRGRGIREELMCQQVPDPPPNVDFSIIEDPHAKFNTARERLTAHNTDPTCRGCHQLTDPLGLTLEKFDGAGQYRETEHGAPIDAAGSLDGVAYTDAAGLGRALHDSDAVKSCIVTRLYGYGVGRPVLKDERPLMKYYKSRLDQSDYRMDNILRLIVYSKAFFSTKPVDEPPASKIALLN